MKSIAFAFVFMLWISGCACVQKPVDAHGCSKPCALSALAPIPTPAVMKVVPSPAVLAPPSILIPARETPLQPIIVISTALPPPLPPLPPFASLPATAAEKPIRKKETEKRVAHKARKPDKSKSCSLPTVQESDGFSMSFRYQGLNNSVGFDIRDGKIQTVKPKTD